MRSAQFLDGQRSGRKWAIDWLHERAKEMNDHHAVTVLNCAAHDMGHDAKLAGPSWRKENRKIRILVRDAENKLKTSIPNPE